VIVFSFKNEKACLVLMILLLASILRAIHIMAENRRGLATVGRVSKVGALPGLRACLGVSPPWWQRMGWSACPYSDEVFISHEVGGSGALEQTVEHHAPVAGAAPVEPKSEFDEILLEVPRLDAAPRTTATLAG